MLSQHLQSLDPPALHGCLQSQVGTILWSHQSGGKQESDMVLSSKIQAEKGQATMHWKICLIIIWAGTYWRWSIEMSNPFIFNEKTKPFSIITLWNYRTLADILSFSKPNEKNTLRNWVWSNSPGLGLQEGTATICKHHSQVRLDVTIMMYSSIMLCQLAKHILRIRAV